MGKSVYGENISAFFDGNILFLYFYTDKNYFSITIFIKKILKTIKRFFYEFYFSTETFISVQLRRISKPQLDLLICSCNKVHDKTRSIASTPILSAVIYSF